VADKPQGFMVLTSLSTTQITLLVTVANDFVHNTQG
jgi:hypothetical protein